MSDVEVSAVAPPVERVLFRSDDVEVIFCEGSSDFLLITFGELGMRANGRRWWAAPVARKLGLSAIGFVAVRPNWFPDSAIDAALASAAVTDVLAAHPRRITYGFSMGGYGALRHARALGASASIAVSPQWSIDPADTAEHDRRFSRFFNPAGNAGMRIGPADRAGKTFIVFDPGEVADRWHVARIADAIPDAVSLHARATGHWTARALADSAMAGRMMQGALDGDAARMRHEIAVKRRAWPQRPLVLARQLSRTRPGLAVRIATRHAASGTDSEVRAIFERASDRFLHAGDAAAAGDAARQALAISPASATATSLLARSALRMGDKDFALEMAWRSVELAPDKAAARFMLAAILVRAGQHGAAAEQSLRGKELQALGPVRAKPQAKGSAG